MVYNSTFVYDMAYNTTFVYDITYNSILNKKFVYDVAYNSIWIKLCNSINDYWNDMLCNVIFTYMKMCYVTQFQII